MHARTPAKPPLDAPQRTCMNERESESNRSFVYMRRYVCGKTYARADPVATFADGFYARAKANWPAR